MVVILLQNHTRQRERELELAVRQLNELLHEPVRRQVAALRYLTENASVELVVFVEGVLTDFEEIIGNQPVGLMRVKCKRDVHRVGEG